jgi:nucleoside-diphosphate-sugar epimerase
MGRLVCRGLSAAGHGVTALDLASADFAGLAGIERVTPLHGDLGKPTELEAAARGADCVVHLAAILPPVADARPELARRVNVDGTRNLVEAVAKVSPSARIVFSSSVSVYGKPSGGGVITTGAPVNPDDVYAQTKAESEALVRDCGLEFVALRISGVAIPVFQEPPAAWPFLADQRIEFVHRDDAVSAIVNAAGSAGAANRVYNISGGETWRMTGAKYVADYFNMIEVDPASAVYQDEPGHFAFYDGADGPQSLRYRNNPYPEYLNQLQADIDRLMAE